ncbi:MAG: glycosyltransferase [Candidatus Pacebacteria bacterium]|nr:glycosyltransferase [Candidatus Paceibacterota bacterium]
MSKKNKPKAVIIIPTFNESGIISQTVGQLQKVFAKIKDWELHILVVDDTSPDKTYQVVKKLQKKWDNLHLLINPEKKGLGAAYLKGMKHAFSQLKADVVFEFDADLSHDPTKIPLMLEKIDQGYEMVLGSRYIPGGSIPQDWGLHRKFLSVVGNLVIRTILTNFSIADWTGGYRAITKKVYQLVAPQMKGEEFSGYTFQIGFLHKTVRAGFKVTEVPFHFKDRTIGQSKIGPEFIFNNFMYLSKVRLNDLLSSRVFRFLVVGTIGAMTQLISLQLWRMVFPFQLANFLAIETAVLANFILSNSWTFADRKLKPSQIPAKFLQFNLASGGSILIQIAIAFLGETLIGIRNLFAIPIINFMLDTGTIFSATGILVGMFWNFFAYNFFIWKKKK